MRRLLPVGLPVGLLLAVAGCVRAEATMLGGMAPQPAVLESEVRVFLADQEVPTTCAPYALLTLQGDANMTSQAQMIGAARRRAGKVGANAVKLAPTAEPGAARQIAQALLGTSANRKGEMVAYRCS